MRIEILFNKSILFAPYTKIYSLISNRERMFVKMKSKGMVENDYILKYLNRLSDLIFLLACFEEKGINRAYFPCRLSALFFRRWAIIMSSIILLFPASLSLSLDTHASQMPRLVWFPFFSLNALYLSLIKMMLRRPDFFTSEQISCNDLPFR